jgi:hypothetical protein
MASTMSIQPTRDLKPNERSALLIRKGTQRMAKTQLTYHLADVTYQLEPKMLKKQQKAKFYP